MAEPPKSPIPVRVGAPDSPPEKFSRVELKKIDVNLFLAEKEHLWEPGPGRNRLYGGQVIGQALAAAIKSTPDNKVLHSMHCYFLKGGRKTSDIVYTVKNLRDGRSFCTRMVIATQLGIEIFVLTASFQIPEYSSLNIYPRIPLVPHHKECMKHAEAYNIISEYDSRVNDIMKVYIAGFLEVMKAHPIEIKLVRIIDPLAKFGKFKQSDYNKLSRKVWNKFPYLSNPNGVQQFIVWIKAKPGIVQDDDDSTRALFGYVSDWFLLATALGGGYTRIDAGMMASLDHSMWFHADFSMNEWMLFTVQGMASQGGRGLSLGRLYKQDGTLAVTCTQEGVIRLRKDQKKAKL